MLKVWGRRSSANVQKVMWLVGELNIPHEHIDAGGKYGGLDTPEFLAMNPNGLVPVLDDEGAIVWESHACVRYLAAQYGAGSPFWPEDPKTRAQGDKWMEWSSTTLQPDAVGLFVACWRTPPEKQNRERIAEFQKRCVKDLTLLDAHLARNAHVAGDEISMGDIAIGALLFRHFTLGIAWPAMPNLEAYYKRLTGRPAYAAHVMIDYAELRGVQR